MNTYQHYKETSLPITYRRQEIERIITALAMQRSIQVAGLSGMGKSNLLRFLVSHPQLLKDNPQVAADSVYFLHIDCNKLNPANALNFYRECTFKMQVRLEPAMLGDEYFLYKALETALQNLDWGTLVVLVVDRTEYLYAQTGQAFFSQLRSLRDEARGGKMAFIFGGQRPATDLYDLGRLFSETCWVGPFSEADRVGAFAEHETRLRIEVTEPWRRVLWRITGAHPGLLKNSLEWLKQQGPEMSPPKDADLLPALLTYLPVQRHCHALWQTLTPAEQRSLLDLNRDRLSKDIQSNIALQPLTQGGLLVEAADGLHLFSPLWHTYLQRHIWFQQRPEPMQVEMDQATRRVTLRWQGQTAQTIITRKLVFDLLYTLSADSDKVFGKDELINTLYPEAKAPDVFDDALFQLVAALRKALDRLVKRLCPQMTTSCLQNVRGVGYRLIVDLPTQAADVTDESE